MCADAAGMQVSLPKAQTRKTVWEEGGTAMTNAGVMEG